MKLPDIQSFCVVKKLSIYTARDVQSVHIICIINLLNFKRKFVYQELEGDWPQFGEVVQTRSYGSLQARYIYHSAVARYRNLQSIQVTRRRQLLDLSISCKIY